MGYRVVVPDLYRGKAGYDAEEAQHNMKSLDFKAAVQDVAGAAAWLKAEGSKKVGTIGFCMGEDECRAGARAALLPVQQWYTAALSPHARLAVPTAWSAHPAARAGKRWLPRL